MVDKYTGREIVSPADGHPSVGTEAASRQNDQDQPRGEPATNPQEMPASAASPGSASTASIGIIGGGDLWRIRNIARSSREAALIEAFVVGIRAYHDSVRRIAPEHQFRSVAEVEAFERQWRDRRPHDERSLPCR